MGYKNLLIRLLSSSLLIFVYFFLFLNYVDSIIYFISFIYILIILEILLYFKKFRIILLSYILFSYIFCILYFHFYLNIYEFTFLILCMICFDSLSYFFGKIYGKTKIALKISPNKTYEGLFGGIVATNIIFFISYFYFDFFIKNTEINFIIFINLIISFSFFGDLTQSYFKRLNDLKDSSQFIPGHGGFFDRFDSFLLVIIPYSIYKILI